MVLDLHDACVLCQHVVSTCYADILFLHLVMVWSEGLARQEPGLTSPMRLAVNMLFSPPAAENS